MAMVSTYLNFAGNTEDAFNFYRKVFRSAFSGPIRRMGAVPSAPDMPTLSEAEKNLVMHVALPILGGHLLMGTDAVASMGQTLTFGNNVSISLSPDTRTESERLFKELSEGGTVGVPLQDMFWGDYFGALVDRFGVRWMVNCSEKKQ